MVKSNHCIKMADYTDDQLVCLVKSGNSDAFVELTVRSMTLIRVKEGLLGLLSAARNYDIKGKAEFRTYAGICINNRIIMAYRAALSHKNLPLNNSVSLSDGCSQIDISDCTTDPETMLLNSESFKTIKQKIQKLLSKLEQQVLMLYLGGCSYQEIAAKLSVTPKVVDNALQRVRLKLRQLL